MLSKPTATFKEVSVGHLLQVQCKSIWKKTRTGGFRCYKPEGIRVKKTYFYLKWENVPNLSQNTLIPSRRS